MCARFACLWGRTTRRRARVCAGRARHEEPQARVSRTRALGRAGACVYAACTRLVYTARCALLLQPGWAGAPRLAACRWVAASRPCCRRPSVRGGRLLSSSSPGSVHFRSAACNDPWPPGTRCCCSSSHALAPPPPSWLLRRRTRRLHVHRGGERLPQRTPHPPQLPGRRRPPPPPPKVVRRSPRTSWSRSTASPAEVLRMHTQK